MLASVQPTSPPPPELLIPLAALFGCGLILWFAGGRMLPVLLAFAGCIAGAAIGWTVSESVGLAVPSWAVALAAGTGAAIGAALSYRLTLALSLGVVLAICGALTVGVLARGTSLAVTPAEGATGDSIADAESVDATDAPADEEPWPATTAELVDSMTEAASEAALDSARRDLDTRIRAGLESVSARLEAAPVRPHLDGVQEWIGDVRDRAVAWWRTRPSQLQTLMLATAACAGFLGVMVGLLASRWTAAVVTAAVGAALMLGTASILLRDLVAAAPFDLPPSTPVWIWVGLTMAGLVVQWRRVGRRSAPPPAAPAPASG